MRRLTFLTFTIIALALSACGSSEAAIATAIAQTQQIAALETAAAVASQPTATSVPPSNTPLPTDAATATFTLTPTVTLTPTRTVPPATPTNNPDFNWKGNWVATWNGATYPLSVSISGNSFSATLNDGVLTFTFVGTLKSGGQVATGTWSHNNGGTGTFQAQIKSGNLNQFIGSKTDDGSGQPASNFCGWRSGTSMPSPCKWP
jgi:hypothetical protein